MAELTGKTISELPSATTLADADLLPISAGGASKKLAWSTLKATIQTIVQTIIQTLKPHKEVDYVDESSARANFTLTSGGYYRIEPPAGALPSGAKVLAVAAIAWTSGNGIAIIPYGTAGTEAYVIGPSEASVSGLKCRWWYAV